jgi:hypothetical protein
MHLWEKSLINMIWLPLRIFDIHDLSKWFASSLPPICSPSFSFIGGAANK